MTPEENKILKYELDAGIKIMRIIKTPPATPSIAIKLLLKVAFFIALESKAEKATIEDIRKLMCLLANHIFSRASVPDFMSDEDSSKN